MHTAYDEVASFSHLVGDLGLSKMVVQFPPASSLELVLDAGRSLDQAVARRVLFDDLVAYDFDHGGSSTVIFDIVVVALERMVATNPQWEASARHHNWPVALRGEDSLVTTLEARGVAAFELQSSFGLFGLVLAGTMVVQDLQPDGARVEVARWPLRLDPTPAAKDPADG